MAITVNSPYSGKPVKVRDQDVKRAVRDEEGRIFYVLPKSDGSGFFGSMTRAGGEKEERRAAAAQAKADQMAEQATRVQQAPHDSTGRRRGGWRGLLVIVILVVIVAILTYLFSPWGPFSWENFRRSEMIEPGGRWETLE